MARVLYYGTSGSNDPTRAGLTFNHAIGCIDAGHQPEIFLAGEATYLMKDHIAKEIFPVAMPPLKELIAKVIEHRIPIYVWGKCGMARGVTEDDLKGKNAQFVNPKIFAEKVVAADKVVSD